MYTALRIIDHEVLSSVSEHYRQFLQQTNGAILFDGGLHIRGAVFTPHWHSLRRVWFGDFALYKLFPAIKNTDIPIAQDCLGNQFLLRESVVHKLDAESGDMNSFQMDLEAFLNRSQENPVDFLTLQPLHQFLSAGGKLKPGLLLSVYLPFITMESANGISLRAIPMF